MGGTHGAADTFAVAVFTIRWFAMARVLLVESNEFVRDVLRSEMEAAGHRVDCVGRRIEAEIALGQVAYDLLVCDMQLPDGSGHDLVTRAGTCGMRALVMADTLEDIAEPLIAAPWVTYLHKPFKLGDLRKALELSLGVAHPATVAAASAAASATPGR